MPEKCAECYDSDAGGPRYGYDRCKECLRLQDKEVRERIREQKRAQQDEKPEHRAVTRTPGSKSTMLFYHGRKVGVVTGYTFTTHRTRERHFARKHGGYGINVEVFDELKAGQVGEIILIADGTPYQVTLADWDRYGVRDTLSPDDGEQIFLSEGRFRVK